MWPTLFNLRASPESLQQHPPVEYLFRPRTLSTTAASHDVDDHSTHKPVSSSSLRYYTQTSHSTTEETVTPYLSIPLDTTLLDFEPLRTIGQLFTRAEPTHYRCIDPSSYEIRLNVRINTRNEAWNTDQHFFIAHRLTKHFKDTAYVEAIPITYGHVHDRSCHKITLLFPSRHVNMALPHEIAIVHYRTPLWIRRIGWQIRVLNWKLGRILFTPGPVAPGT